MADFTIIDDGHAAHVAATVDGTQVRLPPEALKTALGWELKPQGLCRGELCIATAGHRDLVNADGIDLAGLAELLARPLAVEPAEHVAYLGVSAVQRSQQLATLEAPDFTLPDLDGRNHSLSDYRGKKVLLLAYASW
jgi:hypothetical protein